FGTTANNNIRFGSKADMSQCNRHVRFTPESGHVQCKQECPLWAKSGHEVSSNAARAIASCERSNQRWTAHENNAVAWIGLALRLPCQSRGQPSKGHRLE